MEWINVILSLKTKCNKENLEREKSLANLLIKYITQFIFSSPIILLELNGSTKKIIKTLNAMRWILVHFYSK